MSSKGAPKRREAAQVKVEPRATPPSFRKLERFIPALIVLIGIVAYSNSLYAPFIFDDRYHISENARIRELWPIWSLLANTSRPVVYLSLALNFAFGGLNPAGYHIFNIAVHILAALVLYGILRRTFLSAVMDHKWHTAAPTLAALVAGVWVAHPIQTESVTYTIQRAESLMGMFYLLTLYCVIRSTQSQQSLAWKAAAVVSYLCGNGREGRRNANSAFTHAFLRSGVSIEVVE